MWTDVEEGLAATWGQEQGLRKEEGEAVIRCGSCRHYCKSGQITVQAKVHGYHLMIKGLSMLVEYGTPLFTAYIVYIHCPGRCLWFAKK